MKEKESKFKNYCRVEAKFDPSTCRVLVDFSFDESSPVKPSTSHMICLYCDSKDTVEAADWGEEWEWEDKNEEVRTEEQVPEEEGEVQEEEPVEEEETQEEQEVQEEDDEEQEEEEEVQEEDEEPQEEEALEEEEDQEQEEDEQQDEPLEEEVQQEEEEQEEEEEEDLSYYHYVGVQVSGKRKGKISIALKGAVENNKVYSIRYMDPNGDNGWVSYGSASFSANGISDNDLGIDHLAASLQENATAGIKYIMEDFAEAEDIKPNPLLNIEIDKSFSLHDFSQQYKKEVAQELDSGKHSGNMVYPVLEDNELKDMMISKMLEVPAVIYAGAGCSMGAPSCSPSWRSLMSELVKITFEAAPEEHRVKKLTGADITRQPEETMESFYLILREKLLSVFQLLEEGRPNATHIAVAKLAKLGKIKAIFTTNFDVFFERALEEEGVPFVSVVTQEEFASYHAKQLNGNAPFAVLKIHGTVDRPDTIVAVANHYKMDKGFAGSKADALAHFVRHNPILFVGYSGWDFVHKNYQSFWASIAESSRGSSDSTSCMGLYWLALKGALGGPDMGKILGKHVGRNLHLGAGYLPDFIAALLKEFDGAEYESVNAFQSSIDNKLESNQVSAARSAFLERWVQNIEKPLLLCLIIVEGRALSETVQKLAEQRKINVADSESAVSQADMMNSYMQLSLDLQNKTITQKEYDEAIAFRTMKDTFQYVIMESEKKDELIKLCLHAMKTNHLLKSSETNVLPSLILNLSYGMSPSTTPKELLDAALRYTEKIVSNKKKGKKDRKCDILSDLYLYCSSLLQGSPDEQAIAEGWISDLAAAAVTKRMPDEEFTRQQTRLFNRIQQLCQGKIDIDGILSTQIKLWWDIPDERICAILETGASMAVALIKQADDRYLDLTAQGGFQDDITIPISSDVDAEIPPEVFEKYEAKFSLPLQPIKKRLARLKVKGACCAVQGIPSIAEVMMAFDMTAAVLWFPATKYLNMKNSSDALDHKGFYPKECLPKSVCQYLLPKLRAAKEVLTDNRFIQPILSIMATIGESLSDIDLLHEAVFSSLVLTQGKVTELTPAPIPEALAYAYQEREDYKNAYHWYEQALDGIRTSVIRLKADSIILNACLVAAKHKSIEEAMKWAFSCCPLFAEVVGGMGMVGPSRPILIQQMKFWSQQLGFSSLREAEVKLMSN